MLNVVLIGPQGSGKGTQADLIVEEFGLEPIEAGALIRKRAAQHDKKAEIIDHLANKKGELLPDGIVLDMIYEELEERESEQGYLFDGFPRTAKQYQALQELLVDRHWQLDVAIIFKISDAAAVRRLGARRHCEACGKSYSLAWEPERERCDCGGELTRRADDSEEGIRKRLELFHATTEPVLDLMGEDGILVEVDGERGVEEIFLEIKDKLNEIRQDR